MELDQIPVLDREKVNDGIWEVLTGLGPGTPPEVKIRHYENPTAVALRIEHSPLLQELRRLGGEAERTGIEQINADIVGRGIISDWKNITRNGEQVPYTEDAAVELCLKSQPFRSRCENLAMRMTPYRVDRDEAAVKN